LFAQKYDIHHPALATGDNSCNAKAVEEKDSARVMVVSEDVTDESEDKQGGIVHYKI
jgi:hypothetical protein